MEILDYYDWAILGDHPAGYCAAIDLTRLGYSVVHFPFIHSSLSRISSTGQFFDPEIGVLSGVSLRKSENNFLKNYFTELGILDDFTSLLNKQKPERHLLQPQHKIKLSLDHENFRLEILKEFGPSFLERFPLHEILQDGIQEYEKLWNHLFQSLDQKLIDFNYALPAPTLKTFFSAYKKNAALWSTSLVKDSPLFLDFPEVLSLLSGAVYSGFRQYTENPTFMKSLFGVLHSSLFCQINGGKTSFRKFLLEKAVKSGMSYFPNILADQIFIKENKVIGFQVNQSGKMIGLGGAFYSGALDQLAGSLNYSGKTKKRPLKKSPKAAGWVFTMALTVNKEALPESIPRVGVWKERGAPPIEYEIIDPKDYGYHLVDNDFFFARTLLPYQILSLDSHFQQTISARMFRQIRENFPFIEFHIKNIFPDFRNGLRASRNDYFEAYPYKELIDIPENLKVYESEGVGFQSGIQGIYLCSPESYPQLGEYGPYFSFKNALRDYRKLE